MPRVHCALALLIAIAVHTGCKSEQVAEKHHPATVEESDQKGIMRVTLTERAAERIGIETMQVREEVLSTADGQTPRKVVPYSAILYDKKGDTWTFTNPQPLVYVRHPITVDRIDGDLVVLAEGPPAGTAVVTVGAAELMGTEHKYGH